MYHIWQLYEVWFVWSMRYGVQQTEFFVILDHFLHFYPLKTQKIKIFKIWKNPKDIIISNMRNINDNHMMHGSWDMARDRQNFLQFWAIFCSFTSLTNPKIKISKKWKKCSDISSFCTSAPKIMIICHTVPEIRHVTDVIFIFHFGLFFPLLPP